MVQISYHTSLCQPTLRMHLRLLIKEVGHHRLLGLGQENLYKQGVVDQDRQVDQDHHHSGHHQLLEVVNDQTLQLDYHLQLTAILTIVSVVKVWD